MTQEGPSPEPVTFRKVLARREVIALSFGAMIGWSWVLLTGSWVERAGVGGAVLAFVVGGIAVILISLTYAELVAAMPEAGGEHVYTYRAFGRLLSFVCSWALVMGYVSVPVFESVALATGVEYIFPNMHAGMLWRVADAPVYASLVAVGVSGAIVMTAINYVGIRLAAFVQTIITFMFFLIGAMFLGGALVNGSAANAEPVFHGGVAGAMGVLIMVPALLVGFDVIPQSAEEIKVPYEQVGRLLIISVVMAVLWYVLITAAVAFSLDAKARAGAAVATADANAAVWHSTLAGKLMIIGGIGGILTSWNAFIVGGSRVIYALAKSGLLPAPLRRLHPKYNTPWIAVLLVGILSGISPFFGRTILVWIIDAGSLAIVVAYGMVACAFVKLRLSEPHMPRPFKAKYGMGVGILAVAMSLGLFVIYLPGSPSALVWPYEWGMVIVWALLGVVMYLLSARKASDIH